MKKGKKIGINTKNLSGMAVLSAFGVALALVFHIPVFPAVPFLEYDMADVPIFLGTFMYGPLPGLFMTVTVSVVQGLTVSASGGFIGILMHVFATGTFVVLAGNVYKRFRTFKGAMSAIAVGVCGWMLGMVLWNVVFTPIFTGMPRRFVVDMLGIIMAFNAIKVGANSVITVILYKRLRVLFDYLFDGGRSKPKRVKYSPPGKSVTVTVSPEETEKFAARLAKKFRGGEVVVLEGELGAGKTVFAKGLAKGLGVSGMVTSPTFTVMKEYDGRLKFRHYDMYRIKDESETAELGIRDFLYEKDGVCAIEWNKFDLDEKITVKIAYKSDSEREITVEGA